MSAIRKINVPGVGRLPAFCHATVAGDLVFVSGMLGARRAEHGKEDVNRPGKASEHE